MKTDILITGGGIVGLATAWQLMQRFPVARSPCWRRKPTVARHQTGHNSGVIHSGIYYKPGSFKALPVPARLRGDEAFCAENGIAHDICGKVVVALTEAELPQLESLAATGRGQRRRGRDGVDRGEHPRVRDRTPAGSRPCTSPRPASSTTSRSRNAWRRTSAPWAARSSSAAAWIGLRRRGPDGKVVRAGEAEPTRGAFFINCAGLNERPRGPPGRRRPRRRHRALPRRVLRAVPGGQGPGAGT